MVGPAVHLDGDDDTEGVETLEDNGKLEALLC